MGVDNEDVEVVDFGSTCKNEAWEGVHAIELNVPIIRMSNRIERARIWEYRI